MTKSLTNTREAISSSDASIPHSGLKEDEVDETDDEAFEGFKDEKKRAGKYHLQFSLNKYPCTMPEHHTDTTRLTRFPTAAFSATTLSATARSAA